jgi:hypothetical protein
VSLYVDKDNDTLLEEIGVPAVGYIIPRWQTVSGSQYAHSPATVAALPDARLLQQITLTLLEAGEKAVDPPMAAVMEAVRGDVNIYPGGITWLDAEYDERLGEALRPLASDNTNLNFGLKVTEDTRNMLADAFYLNKISLPEAGKDMTAYEVQKRMEEYVRSALPLFEPAEVEYNAALCDETLSLLVRANVFGPPESFPETLQGREIEFEFESPINSAVGRAKSQAFRQSAELLSMAAQIDPNTMHTINVHTALKDALRGVEAPADWFRSDDEVQAIAEKQAQAAAGQQATAEISQAAQIAEQVGNAGVALEEAGMGQR